MVQPNHTCENFCVWLQATTWIKLTGPQNNVVDQILQAAIDETPVTDHLWNEFLRITGLNWQYYVAFVAQTSTDTEGWINVSADVTITGLASTSDLFVYYNIKNSLVTILYFISGTSNDIAFEFTIPGISAELDSNYLIPMKATDNNIVQNDPGYAQMNGGGSIIRLFKNFNNDDWTDTGFKAAQGALIIPI